ncbi:MAG: polysaccharide biosynthesis tyrosine autokinase [Anaerolineae bacterium]|nr:polysaccharide biosynthesis tyrosine autokinase [Anaerolineae bacterium]
MEAIENKALAPEEEIDLRQYLRVLRRWLWLIALCTIIAAAAAYLVSVKVIKPVYRAQVSLMVEPRASSSGVLQYQDVLAGERIARTYAEILKSRPVLENVLIRLGFPPDIPENELPFKPSVQAVRDTQLIRVSVESLDPKLAADAANTLAQVFVEERAKSQAERFNTLKASLEAQLAKIEEDITRISEQRGKVQDPEDARNLDQQLISLRDMRTRLLASLYEIQLSEAQYTDLITIVERAEVPERPVRPRKLLNTVLAGILGGMLAIMVAFLLEYLDTSIKNPEQIEALTKLPVLGSIFEFESNPRGERETYIPMEHPRSHSAESFRVLRANLEFLSVDKPVGTLCITSAGPEEGKTSVALNLAIAMAQGGKKVALVDADLRRPKVHQILELTQSPGLSEALIARAPVEKYLKPWGKNLLVLTSGRLPPNPADILASQRMGELILELRDMADIVILDSPPILACADTVFLGKHADGLLMVAEWGRTDRSAFVEAVERARQGGLRVLGAVLNRVKLPSKGYYYYYYYSDSSEKKPWWKKLFRKRRKRKVREELLEGEAKGSF